MMARIEDITVNVHVDAKPALVRVALMQVQLRALSAALAASAAMRAARAEILTALAFVAGWMLVTAGIARLTSPVAWYFSLGLLSLSLGGWKLLAQFVWNGLYALTRDS